MVNAATAHRLGHFLFAGLGLALAACVPARYDTRLELVSLQPGQDRRVTVLAAAPWRDTGIQVRGGETYALSTDGRWQVGPFCNATDADGFNDKTPLCFRTPLVMPLISSSNFSTLIGRIGPDGSPFVVGARRSLTASADGTLYLRINDPEPFLWDNTGQVSVSVGRQAAPKPVVAAVAPPAAPITPPRPAAKVRFPKASLAVAFRKVPPRADDVAVVIGNADYGKQGKDIPDVAPAYADAEAFKRYAIEALGVREGNVIHLRDATGPQMVRVFASATNHRGQLYDWVRPSRSRVHVYYAGHGAPGGAGGSAYLVPADADGARIDLNGYPLELLYRNLGRLPAASVTVTLEACFSGASQAGAVISNASPVFLKPAAPAAPANVTVIAAGAANQIASWEEDSSHGLFTKYFLKGMAGEADASPYGDGDGRVGLDELDRYLRDTLTYYARRYYGRDQTAQIVAGKER